RVFIRYRTVGPGTNLWLSDGGSSRGVAGCNGLQNPLVAGRLAHAPRVVGPSAILADPVRRRGPDAALRPIWGRSSFVIELMSAKEPGGTTWCAGWRTALESHPTAVGSTSSGAAPSLAERRRAWYRPPGVAWLTSGRRPTILFALVVLGYLFPIWFFPYLPTQDGPSHLSNAVLLKDYGSPGTRYHEFFE